MSLSTKPIRRWCTVSSTATEVIWLHHASAHGETKAAYLRRVCGYFGGSLASVNAKLVEIEVRVVQPKKPSKRRKAKRGDRG